MRIIKYVIPDTGKCVTIPDDEIKKSMEFLGLNEQGAIDLWLDDNGYSENDEQIMLDDIASHIKVQHGAKSTTKERKKPSTPRVYVNSNEKISVYQTVKSALDALAEQIGGKVIELKNQKLLEISFPNNDRPIKVDIIQKRKVAE